MGTCYNSHPAGVEVYTPIGEWEYKGKCYCPTSVPEEHWRGTCNTFVHGPAWDGIDAGCAGGRDWGCQLYDGGTYQLGPLHSIRSDDIGWYVNHRLSDNGGPINRPVPSSSINISPSAVYTSANGECSKYTVAYSYVVYYGEIKYQPFYEYWYISAYGGYIRFTYLLTGGNTDFPNICPYCTTYNKLTGLCEVDEDCYWGGDSYIAGGSIECFVDISSSEVACYNGFAEFDVSAYLQLVFDESPVVREQRYSISYAGGTMRHGIDFDGPTEIIFKENEYTKNIQLEIFDKQNKVSDENINIVIESQMDFIRDEYKCHTYGNILIEDCNIHISHNSTCCDFVPKDFINWETYEPYDHFYSLDPFVTKSKI